MVKPDAFSAGLVPVVVAVRQGRVSMSATFGSVLMMSPNLVAAGARVGGFEVECSTFQHPVDPPSKASRPNGGGIAVFIIHHAPSKSPITIQGGMVFDGRGGQYRQNDHDDAKASAPRSELYPKELPPGGIMLLGVLWVGVRAVAPRVRMGTAGGALANAKTCITMIIMIQFALLSKAIARVTYWATNVSMTVASAR